MSRKRRSSKQKRSSKQQAKRRAKRRKAHPNGTAVLAVDQKPFLRKAISTCRRLRNELHKKQQRLRHFEENEMGAYNRWLNTQFGIDLTRIRGFQEEIADLEFILNNLRFCELYLPKKLAEVYEELFKRKKEGTLHLFIPPQQETKQGDEDEDAEDEESGCFDDNLDDAFDSIFDDIFGSDEDDEEFERACKDHRQRLGFGHDRHPQTHNGPVKALYRTLAKRLHPDHSDLEEDMRERRWHELQGAYQQGDLDGLQRIEAVCDMDESGLSVSLGLARLYDLAAYHQSHLQPIRQALRAAKRHAAFEFSETDTASLSKQIRQDFRNINSDLKSRINWYQEMTKEILEDAVNDEDDEIEEWFDDQYNKWNKKSTKTPQPGDTRQMEFF